MPLGRRGAMDQGGKESELSRPFFSVFRSTRDVFVRSPLVFFFPVFPFLQLLSRRDLGREKSYRGGRKEGISFILLHIDGLERRGMELSHVHM